MRAELPEIARFTHRRGGSPSSLDLICRVFRVVLEVDDQPVDLGRLEAGNGDVEAFLQEELVKLRQFDSQALAVPSGILRDLVVREQESAFAPRLTPGP